MSNNGFVDKTINHTVFYNGKEYRRYKNDGYYVLYPVVDGVVDYSTSTVEHRLVYELANNVKLTADMQVHHINHDRSDNRPENLIALTASEHTQLHAIEKGQNVGLAYCIDCGKPISRHGRKRCRTCMHKSMGHRTDDDLPSREELDGYIWSMTNVDIGKLYGVTGATIAVWRKKRNLPPASETGVSWSRRP